MNKHLVQSSWGITLLMAVTMCGTALVAVLTLPLLAHAG